MERGRIDRSSIEIGGKGYVLIINVKAGEDRFLNPKKIAIRRSCDKDK